MKMLFVLVGLFLMLPAVGLHASGEVIAGYIEMARLYPGDILIEAKLDTGARNSSLHATGISEFIRSGQNWVRFTVTDYNKKKITLERRLSRVVEIKRHKGKYQRRPAVKMGICLGGVYKVVEVNLVNRSRFRYKLLVGRSFLGKSILVDSALKHLLKPTCPDGPQHAD
jgi:hypothetical protein